MYINEPLRIINDKKDQDRINGNPKNKAYLQSLLFRIVKQDRKFTCIFHRLHPS